MCLQSKRDNSNLYIKNVFQKILEKLLCFGLIQCYYDYVCPTMYSSLCKKFKNKSTLAILFESSK